MNIKLAQNEDFKVITKGGGGVVIPDNPLSRPIVTFASGTSLTNTVTSYAVSFSEDSVVDFENDAVRVNTYNWEVVKYGYTFNYVILDGTHFVMVSDGAGSQASVGFAIENFDSDSPSVAIDTSTVTLVGSISVSRDDTKVLATTDQIPDSFDHLVSQDGDTTAVATNDGTVEVTHGGGYDGPIEDWDDLAEAVGLTMSDNLTPDDIRNELGLPTTATIQEAIDAALNLSWTRSLAFQDAIAAPFSETTAYAVGALCMRFGMLYECTTAHAAGAWDASHFKKRTVVQKIPDISGKANIADLRYKLVSQTVRYDNGYVVDIEDRAINSFSKDTGSAGRSIKLLLPPKVDGYARDFIVRYVVTGTGSVYELTLPATETIDIGSDFNSELRAGVNVVLFTEISDNHWLVGVKGAES